MGESLMVKAGQFKSLFKCVTKCKSSLNIAMSVQLTASGRDTLCDTVPALA